MPLILSLRTLSVLHKDSCAWAGIRMPDLSQKRITKGELQNALVE